MTSYDTQEPAFVDRLHDSVAVVRKEVGLLLETITDLACQYRYLPSVGRSHGQSAQLQSLGFRFLRWVQDVREGLMTLERATDCLHIAKISGAIGNHNSIDPELERLALAKLGLGPSPAASQILPRERFVPLASVLVALVGTVHKIGLAIRLGARSPRPIWHEPFGREQKGSSAMPHKKNPIRTEQLEGMFRLAQGYLPMIIANISTWEERAIEQSCVERIAWPDLFHVVIHSLRTLTKVLSGLQIYPDSIVGEIVEMRGTYASAEAKDLLAELGATNNLDPDAAYRIVQLAALNAFEPDDEQAKLRRFVPQSSEDMERFFQQGQACFGAPRGNLTIKEIIEGGQLRTSAVLEVSQDEVDDWNAILRKLLNQTERDLRWDKIFTVGYQLRNELATYLKIFGPSVALDPVP